MGNHCLPRIVLYGEFFVGYCDRRTLKKLIQRLLEIILWCLLYQLLPMFHPSWELWCLVSHYQSCGFFFWKHLWGCSQGPKVQEEDLQYYAIKLWLDLLLQPLWLPACLASALSLMNIPAVSVDRPPWSLFHEAKPWRIILLKKSDESCNILMMK